MCNWRSARRRTRPLRRCFVRSNAPSKRPPATTLTTAGKCGIMGAGKNPCTYQKGPAPPGRRRRERRNAKMKWPNINYQEGADGMLEPAVEYPAQPAGSVGKYGGMRLNYL